MNYSKIGNVEAFNSTLEVIRTSEAAIKNALNSCGPEAVSAILAGDNIVHVNNLVNVFTGVRKARVISVLKRFIPYVFDKESEQFTTKDKNAKLGEKKAAAFDTFMASEQTFYDLINEIKKADKVDKPVDHAGKIKKDVMAAVEAGFTLEDIMALVRVAVLEAPAADPVAAAA